MPPPMPPPQPPILTSTDKHQKQNQPTSATSTPGGLSSTSVPNFWASGSTGARSNQGSGLFVKDDMGLGGTWMGWSTNKPQQVPKQDHTQEVSPADDRDLEIEMEEAMDEDSSDADDPDPPPPKRAASTQLNGLGREPSRSDDPKENARRQAEDSLARIAQAMVCQSFLLPHQLLVSISGG